MLITPIQQTQFTGAKRMIPVNRMKKIMQENGLTLRLEDITFDKKGKMNIGRAILQRLSELGKPVDLQVAYNEVAKGKSIEPVQAFNVKSTTEALASIFKNFRGKNLIDKHNTGFNIQI